VSGFREPAENLNTDADVQENQQLVHAQAEFERLQAENGKLKGKLHAINAVITAAEKDNDPMTLCLQMGSPAWRLANLIAMLNAENTRNTERMAAILPAIDKIYHEYCEEEDKRPNDGLTHGVGAAIRCYDAVEEILEPDEPEQNGAQNNA
jgi:hypothetical protein